MKGAFIVVKGSVVDKYVYWQVWLLRWLFTRRVSQCFRFSGASKNKAMKANFYTCRTCKKNCTISEARLTTLPFVHLFDLHLFFQGYVLRVPSDATLDMTSQSLYVTMFLIGPFATATKSLRARLIATAARKGRKRRKISVNNREIYK